MPSRRVSFDTTRAHVTARCPFCGGEYTAGHTTDGEEVVLHTLPTCRQYERLEVNDFLEAARKAGAVPTGGGPDLN